MLLLITTLLPPSRVIVELSMKHRNPLLFPPRLRQLVPVCNLWCVVCFHLSRCEPRAPSSPPPPSSINASPPLSLVERSILVDGPRRGAAHLDPALWLLRADVADVTATALLLVSSELLLPTSLLSPLWLPHFTGGPSWGASRRFFSHPAKPQLESKRNAGRMKIFIFSVLTECS